MSYVEEVIEAYKKIKDLPPLPKGIVLVKEQSDELRKSIRSVSRDAYRGMIEGISIPILVLEPGEPAPDGYKDLRPELRVCEWCNHKNCEWHCEDEVDHDEVGNDFCCTCSPCDGTMCDGNCGR